MKIVSKIDAHLAAEMNKKFKFFGEICKIDFFEILYRDKYEECGNQTFFGKAHIPTLLPKKISWKTDKLFGHPHLFESCSYFANDRNFCHFTTPLEAFRGRKSKIDP